MKIQEAYKVKGKTKQYYRCLDCEDIIGVIKRDSNRAIYLERESETGNFIRVSVIKCYGFTIFECECGHVTEWHPGKRALNVMLENRRTRAATLEALASKVDTK